MLNGVLSTAAHIHINSQGAFLAWKPKTMRGAAAQNDMEDSGLAAATSAQE